MTSAGHCHAFSAANSLQTVVDEQVAQFADRIGYMLQSLVFFIEASSEENECFLNLWVADYEKKPSTVEKNKINGDLRTSQ